MKEITLKKKANDENWGMRFVDETDYDALFDEDVFVRKPDGSPLLILLKKGLSETNVSKAWGVLQKINLVSRNRGMAAGRESEIRAEGKGRTLESPKGWDVCSGIIGYFERTVRMPYCRACAWNLENPEKFAQLFPMVKEVDVLFKKHLPDRYAVQKEYADKTAPDFVIPGTVFTTLTVNKNFRTACHKDAGDLERGFSCLSVIRKGAYKGANLVLPNWRVACKLDTYDLIMFDAHEFHGNTQLVPLTKDAVRCSVVYYFREEMIRCVSGKKEFEIAKRRKPGDSLWGDR